MTTTTFNNSILKDLAFVKVSDPIMKAYTVAIVLHSPTQVIEKTIYAESVQECVMLLRWQETGERMTAIFVTLIFSMAPLL